MKRKLETILVRLGHALTFIRLARDEEHKELRDQHLDEADRLIEYAKGLLDGEVKRG